MAQGEIRRSFGVAKPADMTPLLKKSSAWLPIAMSLAVFAAMLIAIAVSSPPVRETDEGVGAHLFQIWLVMEFFMIAFFAIKWLPSYDDRSALYVRGLPRISKEALHILILQVAAVLLPIAIVYFFQL